MATTVIGIFNSRDSANNAVTDLVNQGFDKGDIEVSTAGNNTISGQTGSDVTGMRESGWDKFLEAIHLRAPEEDRGYYSSGVKSGQVLVSVIAADDDADDAAATLQNNGAIDIDEQMADYRASSGYIGTTAGSSYDNSAVIGGGTTIAGDAIPASASYAAAGAGTDVNPGGTGNASGNYAAGGTSADGTVIPIVEEQLEVGKRQVQSGGVRIYRHVTETPVSESVNLHEERVTIDRRPVDRAINAGDNAFQEGRFEVTETAEVPVVAKTARVVEEVVVGKTATDRTETVSDTVRRTDVDVEQIPGDTTVVTNSGSGADTTNHY